MCKIVRFATHSQVICCAWNTSETSLILKDLAAVELMNLSRGAHLPITQAVVCCCSLISARPSVLRVATPGSLADCSRRVFKPLAEPLNPEKLWPTLSLPVSVKNFLLRTSVSLPPQLFNPGFMSCSSHYHRQFIAASFSRASILLTLVVCVSSRYSSRRRFLGGYLRPPGVRSPNKSVHLHRNTH